MKNILIYIAFYLMINAVYGQQNISVPSTGCPINTVSTNPDLISGAFDWRTQNFTVYLSSQDGSTGVATTIVNPFFDQSLNPTTFNLANSNVKDFAPADGWELLYKSFGSVSQGVKTPFFVLYNKYNGTVRVFANIINSGEFPYTAAAVRLSFIKSSTNFVKRRQTAVLNQLGSTTFSAEHMQQDAEHFVPTNYTNNGVNNNWYWVYADFFALFDPCTCGLESDWYLEVGLINNIDVNVTINGLIQETMVDANPNGNPDETEIGGFFGTVQQYLGFGSGIVDGLNGVLKSGNEAKDKGTELLGNADKLITNFGPIIGKEKAKNIARSVGKILYEVPKVNMVMNLAKTLISTVKKLSNDYENLNEPKSVESMGKTTITEYKTNLTVNGTLTVRGGYINTPLKVPGAQVPVGTGSVEAYNPIYNNTLGVFNLFEQPRFEQTKFLANRNTQIIGWVQSYNPPDNQVVGTVLNSGYYVFPEISQLTIKNTPKLVINPAAGLILKSVEYQIVFENIESNQQEPISLQGPMIPGKLSYHQNKYGAGAYQDLMFYEATNMNREELLNLMGYELEMKSNSNSWNGASFSTPYLNQDCFSNYHVFSFSEIKNPQLRVKAIFEPVVNDPTSTVEEIIIIHTFNGIVENIPNTNPYFVTGTPNLLVTDPNYVPIGIDLPIDESLLFFGYPSNLLLSDETISGNIYAIGDLTIGNNVSVGTGNHTIRATGNIYFEKSLNTIPSNSSINFIAGKEIFVIPETIISPEVTLSIDPSIIKPCENIPDVFPTNTEISNFCNGPIYNQRSSAKNLIVSNVDNVYDEIKDERYEWDFSLYPNPTSNQVTVRFNQAFEGASISVTDVFGKEMQVRTQKTDQGFELSLDEFAVGVYLVTVHTSEGSITKQLVKK